MEEQELGLERDEPVDETPDEGYDLFGDGQPQGGGDGGGDAPAAGPDEPAAPQAPQPGGEPRYALTYNGQRLEKPVSELVALAQKGMNYEKAVERAQRQAVENHPAMRLLGQLARQAGMSPEQYLGAVQERAGRQGVQQLVAQGVPEREARELYALRRQQAAGAAAMRAAQQRAASRKPFQDFVREYPNVTQFPQPVLTRIQAGESPVAAYRAWELEQAKAQLAARQAADNNRATAPGSAAGLGGGAEGDPFLAGFAL